jgi:microcystin-dependent protein
MARRKGRAVSETVGIAPVQFPPGTVISFAGSTAPEGWMLCDGAAISRTDYAGLFAAIGTTHGVGDGSTTFNLPNAQGLVPRGAGSQVINGRTKDGGSLGNKLEDQMQRITGSSGINNRLTSQNADNSTGAITNIRTFGQNCASNDSATLVTGFSLDSANSPSARASSTTDGETRPSSIAFNFIIKV